MTRNASFLTGVVVGALCMYAFDPNGGRRRRALARDKFTRLAHKTGGGLDAAARDLSNRAAGSFATARGRRRAQPDDRTLEERVRAALGRQVSHPRAIDVQARNGSVRLTGPVLAHEVNALLSAVQSVSGVIAVANELELHTEPGHVPSLQGGSADTGARRP